MRHRQPAFAQELKQVLHRFEHEEVDPGMERVGQSLG